MVNLWMSCKGYGEMSQIFYEWDELDRDKFIHIINNTGYSGPNWEIAIYFI